MSFFDDASLAFLPSSGAGKDGKAYSIKPTTGDGDFTFSRGSNLAATRVDVNGLIEKGRENLLLQSNSFSTSPWNTNLVTATSGQSGYNGNNNAWKIDLTGATGNLAVGGLSVGSVGTYSVYAKAGTLNWILLGSQSGNIQAYINLSDGSIGTTGVLIIEAKTEDIGGGWYRCSMTYSGTATVVRVYPAQANGNLTATSGNIYIQDSQVELGLAATDYIESGATTGKAGLLEDEPRFDYSDSSCPALLLEPQRQNILPYSEYLQGWHSDNAVSYSVNDATSPEGLTNATKVTATSTSNAYFRHTTAATAGDNTFSIFAKYVDCQYIMFRVAFFTAGDEGRVWFDIQNGVKAGSDGSVMEYDIEDYGNGWYRCYVVHNVDVGDLNGYNYVYLTNADGSILVDNGTSSHFYGGQWEAGSYATSYIPTYGTSVTRNGDRYETKSLNNFVDTANGFSFYYEIRDFELTEVSFADYFSIRVSDAVSTNIRSEIRTNGTAGVFATGITGFTTLNINDWYSAGDSVKKMCLVMTNNSQKVFVNGVLKASSTNTLTLPTFQQLVSDLNAGQTAQMKFAVNQTMLFQSTLTDQEAIDLTTI